MMNIDALKEDLLDAIINEMGTNPLYRGSSNDRIKIAIAEI